MSVNISATLAIESAISGGSLSLLRGDTEIGSWVGDASNVMKAENLLVSIDRLLAQSGLSVRDLGRIAVSAGPGSFTGIRIGIVTALGLKMGLSVELASVSALTATIHNMAPRSSTVAAASPVGRKSICVQNFEASVAVDEPKTISEDDFFRLADQTDGDLIVHGDLYGLLTPADNIINAGNNFARFIGQFCVHHRDVVTPPLFVAKSF